MNVVIATACRRPGLARASQNPSMEVGSVCMKPHPCLRRRVLFCIAVTTTHIPMSHSQDKVEERQKEEISREWEGMGDTKEWLWEELGEGCMCLRYIIYFSQRIKKHIFNKKA